VVSDGERVGRKEQTRENPGEVNAFYFIDFGL
jgi:hypothetical protein